jgi:mono/diheme cytochrome c family protein
VTISAYNAWRPAATVSCGSLLVFVAILSMRVSSGAEEPASPGNSVVAGSELDILTGIYSDGQRRQGMQIYLKQCSACHGERLRGGESAPALTGANFREHWVGHTIADLLQKINLMPPKDPGRLTPEESASIIAVILASNGFPAGAADLPAAPNVLQHALIEPPKVP